MYVAYPKLEIKFSDQENKYYIVTLDLFKDNLWYLRKDGYLYMSTYFETPEEGWWESYEEAEAFYIKWMRKSADVANNK